MIFMFWLLIGYLVLPASGLALGFDLVKEYPENKYWKVFAFFIVVMGIMYAIPSPSLPLGFDGGHHPMLRVTGAFAGLAFYPFGVLAGLMASKRSA